MDTNSIISVIAKIREKVNLFIEKELQARSIEGVLPAHGPVLHFLFRQTAPVPIKNVVEDVGRVKSTVTGILNTLERYGYILKMPDNIDSRITLVALSDTGRALQKDFHEISMKLLDTVYGDMPAGDRNSLMTQLLTIESNMT